MTKWKYGNYDFLINPSEQETRIEMVGDEVRMLSGDLISQPTHLKETYSIHATFFQPRNRLISQISLPNVMSISYLGGKFYVLNKTNDRIDVYNSNYVYLSSISLSTIVNKDYQAIDAQPDCFWIVSSGDETLASTNKDTVYKIALNGTKISSSLILRDIIHLSVDPSGIKFFAGNLWVLRLNGWIEKYRVSDMANVAILKLPNGVYYSGLDYDSEYLLVGNNDDYSKIYHVDFSNAQIVNQITFENMAILTDVAYDGAKFYAVGTTGKCQIVLGNTVDRDLDRLRKEIKRYSFVDLIDDMSVKTRVAVEEFSEGQRDGFEKMYDVSMSVCKVDRG
jgi:hypothetical protein